MSKAQSRFAHSTWGTALACLFFLIGVAYYARTKTSPLLTAPEITDANHRSLRVKRARANLSQFSDPKSSAPRTSGFSPEQPPMVVNVYHTLDLNEVRRPSVFENGLLERYGSGRVKYNYHYGADCKCDEGPLPDESGPCVVAGANDRGEVGPRGCHLENIKCRYPRCTTIAVDDEHCRLKGFDARMYRTNDQPDSAYLPLGHRKDSWDSFRRVTDYAANPILLPSTSREFVFNAIYTLNTNRKDRARMSKILETEAVSAFSSFVKMSIRWNRNANNANTEQLGTDDYIKVLMNSAFTLSPMGNNPECFRFHEAVEAGSIPITVLGDLYEKHDCKGALDEWLNSPIIILESWDDLGSTLELYTNNPKELAEKQYDMMVWYRGYMQKTIGNFENLVMSKALAQTASQ